MDYKKVGEQCAEFRENVIQLNLSEFCRAVNANVKSVWAFEHGKANNLKYLFFYLQFCKDDTMQKQFARQVFGGVKNG